ncbi:MAG: PAS domain S-box protein [Xanthomonadaceae bacterium]|nr:PAS domain S-box protein [Xanthomonadaceae bacterium]MDE3071594.1 PAS domain S-box protein [Pseudomonadota bacterium]
MNNEHIASIKRKIALLEAELETALCPQPGPSDEGGQTITRRGDVEATARRQARHYASLSRCNDAIVHSTNAEALFQELCRIAVQYGGMSMAWIGRLDPDTRSLRPVAQAGDRIGEFLDEIKISFDADSPFGHGPAGIAVRENRPVCFQDFLHDPRTSPWHARAARFGLGAVAALPLRCNEAVVGVIALYADATDVFDEATRGLLERMATDIGFALDNFAHEAARVQALNELRESEQRYRALVEQSIAGVYLIQDQQLIYVNPHMAEMLGYGDAAELIGQHPLAIVAEQDRDRVTENIRLRLEGSIDRISYNFTAQCKHGGTIEVGANGARATYQGRPAIVGLMQDITEKTRAEELSRQHLAQLESAFMSTVQVATNLTDVRDSYTSRHARRVGEIAAAIGAELGLDARRQQGLLVAGSLHDIGKISIPMEILCTLDPLTPHERELIRKHPRTGYEILKGIDLPWPVAEVAHQHHERLDGSGYPQGLRGDAIILEARIVMVADVVESMSHDRPYRPGLGLDRALAEIERGAGTLYDAAVADTCLRLFRENGRSLPE